MTQMLPPPRPGRAAWEEAAAAGGRRAGSRRARPVGSGGICSFHARSQRLPLKPNPPARPRRRRCRRPCPRPPRPGDRVAGACWPGAVLPRARGRGRGPAGQVRARVKPPIPWPQPPATLEQETRCRGGLGPRRKEPPGKRGEKAPPPTPALCLLPSPPHPQGLGDLGRWEGAVPAHSRLRGQPRPGRWSSKKSAFLFLSSQMARPLSTPSPSQMQARKKRRGVSVFLSRFAEQRFALSSQGPGPENPGQKHPRGSLGGKAMLPGFKSHFCW